MRAPLVSRSGGSCKQTVNLKAPDESIIHTTPRRARHVESDDFSRQRLFALIRGSEREIALNKNNDAWRFRSSTSAGSMAEFFRFQGFFVVASKMIVHTCVCTYVHSGGHKDKTPAVERRGVGGIRFRGRARAPARRGGVVGGTSTYGSRLHSSVGCVPRGSLYVMLLRKEAFVMRARLVSRFSLFFIVKSM